MGYIVQCWKTRIRTSHIFIRWTYVKVSQLLVWIGQQQPADEACWWQCCIRDVNHGRCVPFVMYLERLWVQRIPSKASTLSGKTPYPQVSLNIKAPRDNVSFVWSLWNLTGVSAAVLPRRLLKSRMICSFIHTISRFRFFLRSGGRHLTV